MSSSPEPDKTAAGASASQTDSKPRGDLGAKSETQNKPPATAASGDLSDSFAKVQVQDSDVSAARGWTSLGACVSPKSPTTSDVGGEISPVTQTHAEYEQRKNRGAIQLEKKSSRKSSRKNFTSKSYNKKNQIGLS